MDDNGILTVVADTKDECINKIYSKYGSNYELMGFRQVAKKGFLGFGKKLQVEQSFVVKNNSKMNFTNNTNYDYVTSYSQVKQENSISRQSDFDSNRNELLNKLGQNAVNQSQLNSIYSKLESLSNEVNSKLDSISDATRTNETHKTITRIVELFEENLFTKSYIKNIVAKIKNEFNLEELEDFNLVEKKVVEWIGESISIVTYENPRPPKVIIIVGPTGVGKTTTIAKMAAKIAIESKEKTIKPVIRLITVDYMRVGAVEQLGKWAEAMELNVDQAQTLEDLSILYNSYKDNSDYIYIDTSGFSPNDYERIAKLKKCIDLKGLNETIYLAVLAGTGSYDLDNIIRNYESFNPQGLIVTKCDETSCYGNIISVLAEKGKKISYVTTGQEVLNSLERASPYFFLKSLRGFNLDLVDLKNKFDLDK